MTIDLWEEASADHDGIARRAALDLASRQLETVMPFLLAARSPEEYVHRSALAQGSVTRIALSCGLDPDELMATAARQFGLYREALAEGTDPLDTVVNATHPGGAGPEKADEHDTGPAPGAYSEVPPGPEKGPVSQVTAPRPPQAGPVTEATASRRTADAGYLTSLPPDMGVGQGSVDMGVDPSGPSLDAGGPDAMQPLTPPGIGQVTSTRDPVLRQVLAVAAVARAQNPGLSEDEARRLARRAVGRFLTADLTSEVMSGDAGGGDTNHGSDGGGSPLVHGAEFQVGKNLVGGAGGGGGLAADAGELAAL